MAMQMEIDERDLPILILSDDEEDESSPLLLREKQVESATDGALLDEIEKIANIAVIRNSANNTALHMAVKRPSTAAALALITKGADVNARGAAGYTPLHRAVMAYNLEAVYLLLEYDVDVSIRCDDNKVAFMYAFGEARSEIAYTLLNYYDDFPVSHAERYTVLQLFTKHESPIAYDLVNRGEDIYCINIHGCNALSYSLKQVNTKLFTYLWNRIDRDSLLRLRLPFLLIYDYNCEFDTEDWMKFMYLILSSDMGLELVDHAVNYINFNTGKSFFNVFVNGMYWRVCKEEPPLFEIYYVFMSHGVEPTFHDVDWAVGAGYFESASLFAYYSCTDPTYRPRHCNILSEFLCANPQEKCYKFDYVYERFHGQLNAETLRDIEEVFIYTFKFFSLSMYRKYRIPEEFNAIPTSYTQIMKQALKDVPVFPTLIELCRNRIRVLVNHHMKKPYQFYDALKKLRLPNKCVRQLSFQEPIYLLFYTI